jgi:hypothetical protein
MTWDDEYDRTLRPWRYKTHEELGSGAPHDHEG